MNRIWTFKNFTFYEGAAPETVTISGDSYRKLLNLCFAQADRFSLLRSGVPGAAAGTLERELRPFLVGKFRSYACLHQFGEEHWYDCCLYQAADDAKELLLRHITHLFGRESTAPIWQLPEKYRAYEEAMEAAEKRLEEYIECAERAGSYPSIEEMDSFCRKDSQKARRLWQETFDPADFTTQMEDPCFFQGNRMFFETITHEDICNAEILSEAFGADLQTLGEWLEQDPERFHPPIFSLEQAKDLRWRARVTPRKFPGYPGTSGVSRLPQCASPGRRPSGRG